MKQVPKEEQYETENELVRFIGASLSEPHTDKFRFCRVYIYIYILGRCLQHRGGEPEQAKGADGIQLFALDCIAYIVDAEMDCVCL